MRAPDTAGTVAHDKGAIVMAFAAAMEAGMGLDENDAAKLPEGVLGFADRLHGCKRDIGATDRLRTAVQAMVALYLSPA